MTAAMVVITRGEPITNSYIIKYIIYDMVTYHYQMMMYHLWKMTKIMLIIQLYVAVQQYRTKRFLDGGCEKAQSICKTWFLWWFVGFYLLRSTLRTMIAQVF